MKRSGLIFLSTVMTFQGFSQASFYSTDTSLSSKIDSKISSFDGRANANIVFTVFEGDKQVMRSKESGDGALAFATFTSDVVSIDCLNGVNTGFGFFVAIGRDTSFVNFKVLSNSENLSFKAKQNDQPQLELLVNARTKHVTLRQKPSFKGGEIVSGRVELESEPFFELMNGKQRLIHFRIDCYFNAEPMPVQNKQYKTLRKL